MQLKEIQQILKNKANKKAKESFRKFIPSSQGIYGVRVPVLNKIAKKAKDVDFELVEKLWRSGALEEKLLATRYKKNSQRKAKGIV
ncbi:DNA alkylation repair protein [Patescibacteria group bacterium]|nr:DNA alkylation repair protein [Patescibacteria group bacterium]